MLTRSGLPPTLPGAAEMEELQVLLHNRHHANTTTPRSSTNTGLSQAQIEANQLCPPLKEELLTNNITLKKLSKTSLTYSCPFCLAQSL